MQKRDFLSVADLTDLELGQVVNRAEELRAGAPSQALAGKSVALLFEKPSLRTRASFHVAVHQLGGYSFYMGREEVGLGEREPVADMAKVLSRYVDCIVARVFHHSALEELARHATVAVVNALSEWEHPCQTLADLETIAQHKGGVKGLTIAFIGDGNNVARSLCLGAAALGASFVCCSPPGYELDVDGLGLTHRLRSTEKGDARTVTRPEEAVAQADVVYADVWTSMGQEGEEEARRRAFQGYQVNPALMAQAKPGAIFMHDMPAHYGEEVPPGMLDHSSSVAFDQAENRLHAQKAVLELLLGNN